MKKGIGKSHSKIILIGEHSVVYGYPAIAIPLKKIEIEDSLPLVNWNVFPDSKLSQVALPFDLLITWHSFTNLENPNAPNAKNPTKINFFMLISSLFYLYNTVFNHSIPYNLKKSSIFFAFYSKVLKFTVKLYKIILYPY